MNQLAFVRGPILFESGSYCAAAISQPAKVRKIENQGGDLSGPGHMGHQSDLHVMNVFLNREISNILKVMN